MYIKEIKINGFKSFADKINIELNRNFTGIVGPNGSGKSNIVDALKWVMGEQSVKTLRGSNNMTDVIFNGSLSRSPSRSASVEIVLDNTDKTLPIDYNEVEIKRIVYKTGENEYYMNKDKVRLKDITDLFIDSFSSKESLSIIPQGKISEILSGRPEDRRVIFEEAAGVVKYKKRKEEALRRLDKTNENIEKVDMIISELYRTLEPLEKEASKAKTYKENKEKLASLEIALLAKDIATSSEEYNLTKKEKEMLSENLIKESTTDTLEKSNLESLKLKRTKLDTEVTETNASLLEETEKLNNLNSKKELLKERSKYDKNNQEVTKRLSILKEEKLKESSLYKSLKEKYEVNNKLIEESDKKLEDLRSEEKDKTIEKSIIVNDINAKTKSMFELNNRKEILLYNIENMSKVPNAVKSVLNNPNLSGIENRIASLIKTEEAYNTAIDISLGAASNYIVVESEKNAKDAVEYLKRNKRGRATFYPITTIKPRSIDPETLNLIKNDIGFISVASNLVEYDKKYYNVIMNTLGNIIITKNIDASLSISKKINNRYRIVSLEGDVVNVGGSITGGSASSNNEMYEKTELDKINKDLKILENEISVLNEKLSSCNYNLDVIKEMINKTSLEKVKLTGENELLSESVNESKKRVDEITDEIKALDGVSAETELDKVLEEYYKVEEKKNKIETKSKELEKRRQSIIEEIEEKEASIRKFDSKNKELTEKINALEVKEAKLNMTLDNLLNRLNEEYSLTYERARNEYSLNIEEDTARSTVLELRRIIRNLGEVNLSSIQEYDRINKRYEFLTSQRLDLEESEKNLLSIINEMDDVMIDKFATTFKKVNIEFGKVFKDLFNGGEARLELTDPTNILETGIEIIANPAGKRPGSLSLLSGGEKTLTAISLLFAIMNLKNVPFVILDEVESALDEENVDKFGSYINTYKGKTQLLVITHKKKTMEYLDLLYGITMQESGVSKLVSVKLEDIKN